MCIRDSLYEVEVGDLGESPVCAKVDGEMIYVDVELVDDQIDTCLPT